MYGFTEQEAVVAIVLTCHDHLQEHVPRMSVIQVLPTHAQYCQAFFYVYYSIFGTTCIKIVSSYYLRIPQL